MDELNILIRLATALEPLGITYVAGIFLVKIANRVLDEYREYHRDAVRRSRND